MVSRKAAIVVSALALMLAFGPAIASAIDAKWSALTGGYILYSGDLDDMHLPGPTDAKVAMILRGQLAKDMFHLMGKSASGESCLATLETRSRNDISCDRDKKSGEITCYVGLDLRHGKSIPGAIC